MARSAEPLSGRAAGGGSGWRLAGIASAALVGLAVLGPLAAVLLRAEGPAVLNLADLRAVRFTLWQAAVSAAVSVALAIPVARALARRSFRGRGAVLTLLGAPFILPVLVAVLALLTVFGRSGWISGAGQGLGLGVLDIYGAPGVILAHVFLNLPLAVRLILQGWAGIPAERFRLAATLGFGPSHIRRLIEWPMLRDVLPGLTLLIFLVCTTSFAVALILGGGPASTTIELSIYQAIRFEGDFGTAGLLGVLQCTICGATALGIVWLGIPGVGDGGLGRPVRRFDAAPLWPDIAWISLAAGFLIVPLLGIALRGIPPIVQGLPAVVWPAAARSVVLSLGAAGLVAILAVPLAHLAVARGGAGAETAAAMGLAVSPLVIGTGLFLLLRPWMNPTLLALPVTGLVNALVALPFVLRALVPALAASQARYGRLVAALGLGPWTRLRRVTLPALARPLGFGLGLTAALSMGDLGVIALFEPPSGGTLPLVMYQLQGSYRTDDAYGAALVLVALSLGVFWAFERGSRRDRA